MHAIWESGWSNDDLTPHVKEGQIRPNIEPERNKMKDLQGHNKKLSGK
jgi:hypothetical protein